MKLLAPIHDAVLIEAGVDEIDAVVAKTKSAMCEAGEIVLDGFQLRADAEVVVFPDRYSDERGATMWARVNEILANLHNLDDLRHDTSTADRVATLA
ncbi:MAG: hypothetical protein ABGZ23_25850 [Fuerstiella sp.]